MLALPMRSQDSSPNRLENKPYTNSLPARHRESSPKTSDLRKQVADAMLSVMPPPRTSTTKRPKLSLQTSIPPTPTTQRLNASLNLSIDSPTTRNKNANAVDPPPPPMSSAIQARANFPSPSSGHFPFSNNAPYVLPIGTHSILRNSPLPRRHISAVSGRPPRRMFPPVKRVAFPEKMIEVLPTPVLDVSSEDEDEGALTEEEQKRRREEIQAEDGHMTPNVGRRKRRRDWIWRPLDDDDDDIDCGVSRTETRSVEALQSPEDVTSKVEPPAAIPLQELAVKDESSV